MIRQCMHAIMLSVLTLAVLGCACARAEPVPLSAPLLVYGVVDKVVDEQLKVFREKYQSQLVHDLHIKEEVADSFIRNLGFDEYRRHLNEISVNSLLTNPVVVVLRDPVAVDQVRVIMVEDGLARLAGNPITQPIHDALRSGENLPIVFHPALLPADNLVSNLHIGQYISANNLNVAEYARLALRLPEMPWLLVQPKGMLDRDEINRGLKEVGAIVVMGESIDVVQDIFPTGVDDLRSPMPAPIVMPLVTDPLMTRQAVNPPFFNWSSLNIPSLSEIPGILVSIPYNIVQSILNIIRPVIPAPIPVPAPGPSSPSPAPQE